MVKFEDPTRPFADVVARHRREQAPRAAATFGLWASTHDWRAVLPGAHRGGRDRCQRTGARGAAH